MVEAREGEKQLFYSWSRHRQNDQVPSAAVGLPQGTIAGEALSRRNDHPTSDLALAQPGTLGALGRMCVGGEDTHVHVGRAAL
jgi:hypothetical protein